MGEQDSSELRKTVFESKENEVYRIPALCYLGKETLLAFAEKRDSADDSHSVALVVSTGTLARDESSHVVTDIKWSEATEVVTKATLKGKLENHRPMNPCPVYDEKENALFLFFICVEDTTSELWQIRNNNNKARLCYVKCTDPVTNWNSCMTNLTDSLTDLTDLLTDKMQSWATFAVGPGHGLQTQEGRLIVPLYAYMPLKDCPCPCSCPCCWLWPFPCLFSCPWPCSDVCPYQCPFRCYCSCSCCIWSLSHPCALALYSDDSGKSWEFGDPLKTVTIECQMAEFFDENNKSIIYCNARTPGGYRAEAVSEDKPTWFRDLPSAKKLVETGKGCQGSVVSFPVQGSNEEKPKWLLFSHPSDQQQRKDLGVYVNKSPNDPEAWSEPWVANRGPSGYSDLVYLDNGWFACLFECGKDKDIEQISSVCFSHDHIQPGK